MKFTCSDRQLHQSWERQYRAMGCVGRFFMGFVTFPFFFLSIVIHGSEHFWMTLADGREVDSLASKKVTKQ